MLVHAIALLWSPCWLGGNSIPAKALRSKLEVRVPGTARLLGVPDAAIGATNDKKEVQFGAGAASGVSDEVSKSAVSTSSEMTLKDFSPLPMVSLDSYLPVSVLTVPPGPIDSIDVVPPGFRSQGLVGSVELLLLISSDGVVDDVLVMSSSLPEPVVQYAKQAFRQTRFSPGVINTTSVRSRVRFALSPVSVIFGANSESGASAKNRTR